MNRFSARRAFFRPGAILRRLSADETGSALVFTIGVFLFLFVLVLSAYSVGESVRRKEELQNACDAAAHSASVVQADALSRMAVLNRAMAWHYIQMTKEQMDYIAYRFLHEVRDRFEADMRAVEVKGKFSFDEKAGYYHLQNNSILKAANKLLERFPFIVAITGSRLNRKYWCTYLQFECHNPYGSGVASHADPNNPKVRFIGFGDQTKPENYYAIRLGYDNENKVYYDPADRDLHFQKGDGKGLLRQMEESVDVEALHESINRHKQTIFSLNAMYSTVAAACSLSMNETVRQTLLANLPRDPDGNPDKSLLSGFRWTARIPDFTPPAEYSYESSRSAEDGDGDLQPSCFRGLRNTEEDELLFLNMADGVPDVGGRNVVLSDYFADETTKEASGERDGVSPVSGGLDQWFIRSIEPDVREASKVSINRATPFLQEGGILRGYKNANYDEGAKNAWLGLKDVHRGNHVFHLDSGLLDGAVDNLTGSLTAFNFDFGGFGGFSGVVDLINEYAIQPILQSVVSCTLKAILEPLIGAADRLADVDPSCRNDREAFPDTCDHVNPSYNLVAEYEWATAEWFCLYMTGLQKNKYFPFKKLKSSTKRQSPLVCAHVPIPAGALFGAPAARTKAGVPHSYGNHNPGKMIKEELKCFGNGHSRNGYRSTFINFSNQPFSLPHDPNTILKGYCRIYGDDAAIFDDAYIGLPAKPWLLNGSFFAGGGTVVVALARRRTNVFDWLVGDSGGNGLGTAFSPMDRLPGEATGTWAERSASTADRYMVAISAARAAPAPRSGAGSASGTDTVNATAVYASSMGYREPPKHDIAFDEAAERNLGRDGHPELPDGKYDGGPGKRELEENYRLGCPCGEEMTTHRLQRQWNLSQTDWEGRLLPVRYAYTASSAMDTGAVPAKTRSEWESAAQSPPSGTTGNLEGLMRTLMASPWYRFDSDSMESSDSVLPIGEDDSADSWLLFLKKRKIL